MADRCSTPRPGKHVDGFVRVAACGGHVDLAMLLIERGANFEEINDEGYILLKVKLLLKNGADPFLKPNLS